MIKVGTLKKNQKKWSNMLNKKFTWEMEHEHFHLLYNDIPTGTKIYLENPEYIKSIIDITNLKMMSIIYNDLKEIPKDTILYIALDEFRELPENTSDDELKEVLNKIIKDLIEFKEFSKSPECSKRASDFINVIRGFLPTINSKGQERKWLMELAEKNILDLEPEPVYTQTPPYIKE